MSIGTYIHLHDKPLRCEVLDLPISHRDILIVRDGEGNDLTLDFGRSDEAAAENALRLIEAAQTVRQLALRRLALREAADPITAAKARYDAMTSGPTNMDVGPDGNEPDGPGDAYWQSGGPVHESETFRRDMADAGLSAKVRA